MGFTILAALAIVGSLVFAARFELLQAGGAAVVGGVLYVIGRIRRARFTPSDTPADGELAVQTLLRTEWDSTRAAQGAKAVPQVWWQDLEEAS